MGSNSSMNLAGTFAWMEVLVAAKMACIWECEAVEHLEKVASSTTLHMLKGLSLFGLFGYRYVSTDQMNYTLRIHHGQHCASLDQLAHFGDVCFKGIAVLSSTFHNILLVTVHHILLREFVAMESVHDPRR